MTTKVRNDDANVKAEQSSRGPLKSTLLKVLTTGFEFVAKDYLHLPPGASKAIGEFAGRFAEKAVDGFTAPAGAKAGDHSLNEAGQSYAESYVKRLLEGFIKEVPTTKDTKNEKNLRYLKAANIVKGEKPGKWKLANAAHYVGVLLKKIGIKGDFGDEIKQSIEDAKADARCQDLGVMAGCVGTMRHLLAGALKANPKTSALSEILKAVPVEKLLAKNGSSEVKDGVDSATPKAEMTDATPAGTSRGSNFPSLYIEAWKARASLDKSIKLPENGELPEEVKKLDSADKIIRYVLTEFLGVDGKKVKMPESAKLAAFTKDLQNILEQSEKEAGGLTHPNVVMVLCQMGYRGAAVRIDELNETIKKLEKELDTTKVKGKRTELETTLTQTKAALLEAHEQVQLWGRPARPGEGPPRGLTATFQNLFGLEMNGLTKDMKGVGATISAALPFILEKLVAQKFGIRLPKSDSLEDAVTKYSKLWNNLIGGGLHAHEREKAEKADKSFVPLITFIDKKDIEGTSRKLGQSIAEGLGERGLKIDPAKLGELQELFKANLGKVNSNFDLAMFCVDKIKEKTGYTLKDLGAADLLEVMAEINGVKGPVQFMTALDDARSKIKMCEKDIEIESAKVDNFNKVIAKDEPGAIRTRIDGLKKGETELNKKLEGDKSHPGLLTQLRGIGQKIGHAKRSEAFDAKIYQFVELKFKEADLERQLEGLKSADPKDEEAIGKLGKELGKLRSQIKKAGKKYLPHFEFIQLKEDQARLTKELEALKKSDPQNKSEIAKLNNRLRTITRNINATPDKEKKEAFAKASISVHELETEKEQLERDVNKVKGDLKDVQRDIASLKVALKPHDNPANEAFYDLKRDRFNLIEENDAESKKKQPDQALIDANKKKIEVLDGKIKALSNPTVETYADARLETYKKIKGRDKALADVKRLKDALPDLRTRQLQLEEHSSMILAGDDNRKKEGLLSLLGMAVLAPDGLKERVEKIKEKEKKPGTDDAGKKTGTDGTTAATTPSSTDATAAGASTSGDRTATAASSYTGALGKADPMVSLRVKICDEILSDSSLSMMDKVLLFLLVYADFKNKEQENNLRDFNKTEEKRNVWAEARKTKANGVTDLEREITETYKPKVAAARAELGKYKEGTEEHTAAKTALADAEKGLSQAELNLDKAQRHLADHDLAPEANVNIDLKMTLIERSMQEYDRILRMVDSLLQRYDRLIDQILRSMGQ